MPPEATPTLCLLGGIALTRVPAADGDRLLAQSKVVGTLAYLSLAPAGRFQHRDKLCGLFWPELRQEQARAALRKAVMAIRDTLGDEAILDRGREELRLNRERLSCDATAFAEFADAGRAQAALELYEGELMPGFGLTGCVDFGMWLDDRRVALAQRASAAAWTLAEVAERSGQPSLAGRKARQAITYEWSDERVLRRTMKMLVRIGDTGGAIRVYRDSAEKMLKQLDTEPSDETKKLAEAIRKGESVK